MTAHEQPPSHNPIQELADRQLRCEQRYFDCLDNIFARLEAISEQNTSLSERNQALISREDHFLQTTSRLEESLRLCQEECKALKQDCNSLQQAHKQDCNILQQAHKAELATLAETTRLRQLGIEQLQEELSRQSFALVNAQAELAYLRSRHPKARAKRLLERFGFLITHILPISLLRRGKRVVRKLLRG